MSKLGNQAIQATRNALADNIGVQSAGLLNSHLAAVRDRVAPHSDPPHSALAEARRAVSELRDDIETWVNEGGAGGEVNG